MKHTTILTVASLLSLFFLTLHITDDIVRGISKAESSNTALLILAVFLYGTLVLPERRSGHVIMLLVGLFAAAMPVIHMRGAHYGEIAKSPGGFFFVWTLWALGGLGASPSSSRRADCGVCDGASPGSPARAQNRTTEASISRWKENARRLIAMRRVLRYIFRGLIGVVAFTNPR